VSRITVSDTITASTSNGFPVTEQEMLTALDTLERAIATG
jgi:hypothetical protein